MKIAFPYGQSFFGQTWSEKTFEILAVLMGVGLLFAGTGIVTRVDYGYLLGILLVFFQLATIDNPALSRSPIEREESTQNLYKVCITLAALTYLYLSLPTLVHSGTTKHELRKLHRKK